MQLRNSIPTFQKLRSFVAYLNLVGFTHFLCYFFSQKVLIFTLFASLCNAAKLIYCKILLLHCFGYLCQSSPSGQIHCYKLKVSPPAMYIYILHNLQTMIHCYDTQLTTPQVSSAAQLVTPTRVCCPPSSTVNGPPLSP